MKTRILSVCLAILLLVSLLPVTGMAAPKTYGYFFFDPDSFTLSAYTVGFGEDGEHPVIPSDFDGVPVRFISYVNDGAFLDSMIKSVTIPSTVWDIRDYSFLGCTLLTCVTVNATEPPVLGKDVFSQCNSNLKIYVPPESLNAYKTKWSEYKDIIYPIELPSIKADVTPYTGAYDGESHSLSITVKEPATGATVKYGLTQGDYPDDILRFTEPCDTDVYYKISAPDYPDLTGSAKVTITKANRQVKITRDISKTYNGKPVSKPSAECLGGGEWKTEFKLKTEPDTAYTTTAPSKVGEYTVRVSVTEDVHYFAASATMDFTIEASGPKTGDGANPGLWAFLLLTALLGVAMSVKKSHGYR